MSTSPRNSGNARKKSRTNDCNEHDHISDLPDWAISLILSRLPTKDAVRTSVLSKDWEYKWTFSCNIELDDVRVGFTEFLDKETIFANFVDRTLLLSQNSQSFSLSCRRTYDLNRMETWISTALSRNVQNLDIYYRSGGIVLPSNLLNCYSLRKLELSIFPSTLKVPAEIFFPYLTILKLDKVEILNERSNSDVVNLNLPVLETFELRYCKWLNVKFVEIYAPKMTRFMSLTSVDAGVSDYSFIISGGSRLKYETYGGLPENIILSSGSEVVCAGIKGCCREEDLYRLKNGGIQIRKLVNGFLSLEELALSGAVVKAMGLSKPGISFPKYYKMERLKLYYVGNPEVLLELLHAAPVLKFLLLYKPDSRSHYDYDYDAEKYVPSCILSNLEIVKFTCFGEKMHELFKLTKFFLKNAVQLKRICFSVWKYPCLPSLKNVITKELSTYPIASASLSICLHLDKVKTLRGVITK